MKQILVAEPGGPEPMTLADVPTPAPAPGHALVAIHVAGVNFLDVYFRTGLYKSDRPDRDRQRGSGRGRERRRRCHRSQAPAIVSPTRWSAAPTRSTRWCRPSTSSGSRTGSPSRLPRPWLLQGTTAHYLTRSTFPLNDTHTCLIHAAAGGAGGLVVQMAKAAGARVIGTVSTEAKAREVRALGADHVVIYTEQDFETEVRGLTDGQGVHVVYDSVGKTTFDKSLRMLRPRGMMALFGQSSGPVPPVDPLTLNAGSLFLTRPSLGHYLPPPDELRWRVGEVFEMVARRAAEGAHVGDLPAGRGRPGASRSRGAQDPRQAAAHGAVRVTNVAVAAFTMLVVAMLALWAPRVSTAPRAAWWWVLPFAGALMLALAGGLVDTRGLAAIVVLAAACRLVHHAPAGVLRSVAPGAGARDQRGSPGARAAGLCQPARPRQRAAER